MDCQCVVREGELEWQRWPGLSLQFFIAKTQFVIGNCYQKSWLGPRLQAFENLKPEHERLSREPSKASVQ